MKNYYLDTIETTIEAVAGVGHTKLVLNVTGPDVRFFQELAEQLLRKQPLNERQYHRARSKLEFYSRCRNQDVQQQVIDSLSKTRHPLVKLSDINSVKLKRQHETPAAKGITILGTEFVVEVSFEHRASITKILDKVGIVHERTGFPHRYHKRADNLYFFELQENLVYQLVNALAEYDFAFDENVLEIHEQVCECINNKSDYLSGIVNGELVNVNENALKVANELIGPYSPKTHLQYVDRAKMLGIDQIEPAITPVTLVEKIAYRESFTYNSKPSDESLTELLQALKTLGRTRILVLLETSLANQDPLSDHEVSKTLEQTLLEYASASEGIFPISKQIVLNRQPTTSSGNYFNDAIHNIGFNKWLDEDIEIVYVSRRRLPKLLLSTEWRPNVTIYENLRFSVVAHLEQYIANNCDLLIDRCEERSIIRDYSKNYANM